MNDNIYQTGDRVIEGYGIVDVYDSSGELITTEEISKQMDLFMSRGGLIMDIHTNRPSGKVVDWLVSVKETKEGIKPALYLKTTAFQGTTEDDEFWDRFNTYYNGFSVGGGKPTREYTGKGTKLSFPLWEFSYVPKPANPEANITQKYVAKSNELFSCTVTKSEVVNTTPAGSVKKDLCSKNLSENTVITDSSNGMTNPDKSELVELDSQCDNKDNLNVENNGEVNKMAEDQEKTGPSELSNMKELMDAHEQRLQEVEKYCSTKKAEEDKLSEAEQAKVDEAKAKEEADKKEKDESDMIEKVKKSVLAELNKTEVADPVKKSAPDVPTETKNDVLELFKDML